MEHFEYSQVVLAVDENSLDPFYWIKDDPCGFFQTNKKIELTLLHVASRRSRDEGAKILRKFATLASTTMDPSFITKTRLLDCEKTIQKEITKYVNQNKPMFLILGSRSQSLYGEPSSIPQYCQRKCDCTVIIVKRKYRGFGYHSKNLALAVDTNIMSDRCFEWILKASTLPDSSYLVLVHAVDRESDKVDARKFLASFGTRCRQSQKKHLIQSALLWFKDRTAEQAVERFCEIRNVDTLIIASNGSPTWTDKIKGRASDHCVNYVHSADVIIWKDPNPNPLPQLDLPNWTYVTDQFPKDRNPGSRRHSVDGVVFRNAESRRSSLKQSEADDSQQEIKISRRHSVDNGELAHQVPSPPKEPRPTSVEKKKYSTLLSAISR